MRDDVGRHHKGHGEETYREENWRGGLPRRQNVVSVLQVKRYKNQRRPLDVLVCVRD